MVSRDQAIAIVGAGASLPGAGSGAGAVASFWENVRAGVCSAREVPPGRWPLDPARLRSSEVGLLDHVYSTRGCFLDDLPSPAPAGADHEASIPPGMDPVFSLAMDVCLEAWTSARVAGGARECTGVILANIVLPTDAASRLTRETLGAAFEIRTFGRHLTPADRDPVHPSDRFAAGLPAALVARALGLGGSAWTLDAACASSLYAIKLACDELTEGRADAMITGGISRPDCLFTQMGFSQLRALSPRGIPSPFDASADGLVVGEGGVAFVLRRLEDAVAAGENVLGVIRGIGLSNDRGGSLLAPNSEGQLRSLRAAYDRAGWDVTAPELIECHATGTPLGDATEVASLRALRAGSDGRAGSRADGCVLGSVKSNVGHLLTAAGAVGVLKVLESIRHAILPPTANFRSPAAALGIESTGFRVLREAENWPAPEGGGPRRAAVSAFGFGGINAHVLIEEFIPEGNSSARERPSNGPASIRTAEIGIVGMAAVNGGETDIGMFSPAIRDGAPAFTPLPEGRWWNLTDAELPGLSGLPRRGAWISEVEVPVGRFRIPPNELREMLPQQLLMLTTVDRAVRDAGGLDEERLDRTGVFIGISLDLNTTNAGLRWRVPAVVDAWESQSAVALPPPERAEFEKRLRDAAGPPLTANRTLGSLGGMVASRIAREFRIGGPSFTVSSEECSGLHALRIACDALRRRELDQAIVGAVELDGDVRALLATAGVRAFTRVEAPRPLDRDADGGLIGEGAVALVLRRTEDSAARGETILARIPAVQAGSAPGGPDPLVTLIDVCADGNPRRDVAHTAMVLQDLSVLRGRDSGREGEPPIALAAASANFGFATATSGLLSVARAAQALHQRILPATPGFLSPDSALAGAAAHIPALPQYWVADEDERPRTAEVLCAGSEGQRVRVTLAEAEEAARRPRAARPPAVGEELIFPLPARNTEELAHRLDQLRAAVMREDAEGVPLWRTCRAWIHDEFKPGAVCAAVVAASTRELRDRMDLLRRAIRDNPHQRLEGISGVFYSPVPLAAEGGIAFVFPGSGNSRTGLGREIQVRFPAIMDRLGETNRLHHRQMMPELYMPRRLDWSGDWRTDAARRLAADDAALIVGHVSHAIVMCDLIRSFGVEPTAAVGYSLGESTALFALRAWNDRDEMMRRMTASTLFRSDMVAPFDAARKAWGTPEGEEVRWAVGIADLPADVVRERIASIPRAALLIVNAPRECVIGGDPASLERFVREAACSFVPLPGISAVHCEVAEPVREAYRAFHHFETVAPPGVRFYSGARGEPYEVSADSAADALVGQAVHGIDFPKTVTRAWEDGARIFVEVGPGNSCSRMIDRILQGRPHVARSACVRDRDGVSTLVRLLAQLVADGVPVRLGGLYPDPAEDEIADDVSRMIRIPTGGGFGSVAPPRTDGGRAAPASPRPVPEDPRPDPQPPPAQPPPPRRPAPVRAPARRTEPAPEPVLAGAGLLADAAADGQLAMAEAHSAWLRFSAAAMEFHGRAIELQMDTARRLLESGEGSAADLFVDPHPIGVSPAPFSPELFMNREQCLEFGRGLVGPVLGALFAEADTFPTRVRLPDEPLMLVDRIISVEGEPRSMSSGRLVTEHDVLHEGWYLDHDTMPTGLSVEAGQADLFLSGYLGIDFETRGLAMYRLLDAQVIFHRHLPRPGEVIRYDIRIDRFIRQGETHIFFFNFDATIDGDPLMSMRNGSAGFFTRRQLDEGKGLVLTGAESQPVPGRLPSDWRWPLEPQAQSFGEAALSALREGDPAGCFGPLFDALRLKRPLGLPSGRMALIDRAEIIPGGGRFGLGLVRSEIDIRPADWFLTCHFTDDNVMPGTLMYESCMQTLRLFLMRIGWTGEAGECTFEPVPGVASRLRCRGQVIPETRRAAYEIHVRELGYNPEPYALADAIMYSDDRPVVLISDMSVRLRGATRASVEALWPTARPTSDARGDADPLEIGTGEKALPAIYDRASILEFCHGAPSRAFGPVYAPFDRDRFLARLPSPPYLCMDRVTAVGGKLAGFKAGAWVETQFDVDPEAWYFRANRQSQMPFSILIEHALQACGWLSAYVGSALTSEGKLQYRNLDGRARLFGRVDRNSGLLTTRAILTDISRAGGMIIQKFRLRVRNRSGMVYDGNTAFGFFTPDALANQAGVTGAKRYAPDAAETARARSFDVPGAHPMTPDDPESAACDSLAMPATAYRMIERIDMWIPDGGPAGLGFIRGGRPVRETDWYFKAHFYQDPVQPGSLGLEAFIQLLKIVAVERWGAEIGRTHEFSTILPDAEHVWKYRGQVLPTNREITVEAAVTLIDDREHIVRGDGYLIVDGLVIYEMKDFAVRATPAGDGSA